MTKYMTEEKQKLETHYRNNKKMHYLIQQNTEMKKQIAELKTSTRYITQNHRWH